MFTAYFYARRIQALEREIEESQQQRREYECQRLEAQRRLEELTIPRLVAEPQLHDAKRLRCEAEYKLLALKDQRSRTRRNRNRRALR